MKACVHINVSGRVQGVFFRKSACDKAEALDLVGLVRNCMNGTVEVVVEGESVHLQEFVDWCHQGSPMAQVRDVKVSWRAVTGEFKNFFVE